MLEAVVVVRKRASRVVRWIDEHAFHFSRELALKSFQRQQVVAENQSIVEEITPRNPADCVKALGRLLQQNTRFQVGADIFVYPGEFELLTFLHCLSEQRLRACGPDIRVPRMQGCEWGYTASGAREAPAKQAMIVGIFQRRDQYVCV